MIGDLPLYPTSFVGRERETAELRSLIELNRLVSVVGPGGSGKTRLAVEVARSAAERSSTTTFVDLGALPPADHGLVPSLVLVALTGGKTPPGDAITSVIDRLNERNTLLVLDNCEHVLEATGSLASAISFACPSVRILATSRRALDIESETVIRLEPLDLPEASASTVTLQRSAAARLFCERASVARPSFALTSQNVDAVRNICVRLDGLPLAIELAAARVKILSVEQIDEHLTDRFRILSSDEPGPPGRHRTLDALLDWSYDLLSEAARITFRRASVFVAGWDLDAAEAVCAGDGLDVGDVVASLVELADTSLLSVSERSGRARYRFLETVRAYGEQKLAAIDDPTVVRDRLAGWAVAFAEDANGQLTGADADAWLARIDLDEGNLRSVLDREVVTQRDEAVVLAGALWRYWHIRGRLAEGIRWIELALACPSGDLGARARALNGAANLLLVSGRYDDARRRYEEALEIRRQTADRLGVLSTLNDLGTLHLHVSALDEAHQALTECLSLADELEDRWGEGVAHTNLGELHMQRKEHADAAQHLDGALEIWRSFEFDEGVATCLLSLGEVARAEGEFVVARQRLSEALTTFVHLGHEPGVAATLQIFAALERLAGDPERAATVLGAASRIRERGGISVAPAAAATLDAEVEELTTILGPHRYARAVAAGSALDLSSGVALALGEFAAPVDVEIADEANVFRQEGDFWTIAFRGTSTRQRDAKGLGYLAMLLASPSREFHVAEMVGVASEPAVLGHAGDVLDQEARDAYQRRIVDLREEVEEAESWNDPERAGRARAEIDSITSHLAAALGLSGRSRRDADAAERIRKAVTNRIKASIAKIRRDHPALGVHLANAVRTGTYCSYVPDEPVSWST